MKTFAVIDDAKVVDFTISESKEQAEESTGKTCIEYFNVVPGWSYVDGTFISPA